MTGQAVVIGTAAAVLLTGCAAGASRSQEIPAPTVAVTMEALVADAIAEQFINRLLESESRLLDPDSLFVPGATVMADGEIRVSLPRLAGVGLGGVVQLVTSEVSTRGAFVWGVIEYRWLPMFETDAIRSGVATMIIAQLKDGQWGIVHLHSSSPPEQVRETPRSAPSDTLDGAGRGGGTLQPSGA